MNAIGRASASFNPSDQAGYFGVSLVPGTCGDLFPTGSCASLVTQGVPTVTSSPPCLDPALPPGLWGLGQTDRLPDSAVCSHGGPVLHKNETFALTWDAPLPGGPQHNYFSGTRLYVEQFLRDVADASGALTSPYAVTTQYSDGGGSAQNSSKYGGGCIDYGSVGGSQCEFGNPTGPGHDFPTSGCTPSGVSYIGAKATIPNLTCLTDTQLQAEVSTMVTQTGMTGRTQPGYSPEVVLLTPPGVETCLDAAGKLCSANYSITRPLAPEVATTLTGGGVLSGKYQVELTYVSSSGQSLPGPSVEVPITSPVSTIKITTPESSPGVTGWYAYVTAPDGRTFYRQQSSPTPIGTDLTLKAPPVVGPAPAAGFCSYHSHVHVGGTDVAYVVQPWTGQTRCDEPDTPAIADNPTPQELSKDFGIRLASPISQSHIASIVNPQLNGWFALDGAGINDNGGCIPLVGLDSVPVGSSSQSPYFLQREFNNAGVISLEPTTYGGCAPNVILTPSFVVPSGINQGEEIQFDGSTTASTLLVPNAGYKWDFGDNSTATGSSVVHSYAVGGTYNVKLTVTDRGGNTQTLTQTVQVLGPNGQPVNPPTTQPGSTPTVFHAHLQLLPQGLRAVLRRGISLRVTSNEAADGIATVTISRALAKRLGIKLGNLSYVVIGRGTLSGKIQGGTVQLHLHLPHSITSKLANMRHATLTVHLKLTGPGGGRQRLAAAGQY
ncbi:MAG TPA: PKD domain-containing protein [Solirubrobacteraceae bacterium]|nr:PKD domain-containing protein [Solirubrobacteraceae bacterium]